LPKPAYPFVIFTGTQFGWLSPQDRDWLWTNFEAPVFEQLLSPYGDIIAEECDAHDGLHLVEGNEPPTDISADIDSRICGCGRLEPRLIAAASRTADALAVAC
jgi:hypothetical protein